MTNIPTTPIPESDHMAPRGRDKGAQRHTHTHGGARNEKGGRGVGVGGVNGQVSSR